MKYIRLDDLKDKESIMRTCKEADDVVLAGEGMDMKLVVMDIGYFYEHFFNQYLAESLEKAQKQIESGECVTIEEMRKEFKEKYGLDI
ncbi:MAG: hypothetical protein NC131_13785 [Roseburia sp.]|nr:hypothetical protein [Roseburia sp.]